MTKKTNSSPVTVTLREDVHERNTLSVVIPLTLWSASSVLLLFVFSSYYMH